MFDKSQTEGGLGTLKSIATPYTVTYMACLYTSHICTIHRCEGITNRALASGGGCYSPSRVTTEKGVVAICSTFFTSHTRVILLTEANARISSICSLPQRNWQDLAHLSVRGRPHEKKAKYLYHLLHRLCRIRYVRL